MCTEKAFAGPGIKPIYQFLHEKHPDLEFDDNLTTEQIIQMGVKHADPLCTMVADFFLEMYATEVGNMVCRTKPLSGIYLVGKYFFSKNFYSTSFLIRIFDKCC